MESRRLPTESRFCGGCFDQFCDWDGVEADYEGPARISDKCSGRGHSGLVLLGDGDNPFGTSLYFCRILQFYPGHFRVYKRLDYYGSDSRRCRNDSWHLSSMEKHDAVSWRSRHRNNYDVRDLRTGGTWTL